MASRVTPQQVIRLAAEAGLSIDTVKKYLGGEGRVTSTTEDRMRRALETLKIAPPDREPAPRAPEGDRPADARAALEDAHRSKHGRTPQGYAAQSATGRGTGPRVVDAFDGGAPREEKAR
jgi:hypothetical protein